MMERRGKDRIAAFHSLAVARLSAVLLLLAGFLFAAPVPAQTAATPAQPESVAPVTEPTLMIVEFPRGARFVGFPRRCPGSTEEDPENEICLAELYQGPAYIVRHLSGPRVRRGEPLRMTAHARRWPPGTRMLVLTRPFEDRGTTGNFALWWHLPERSLWPLPEDDDYCVWTETLARWDENPVTRQFAQGFRRRYRPEGDSETLDFRCIRG